MSGSEASAGGTNPLTARLREILLQSTRLFADETVVPVLNPGRGRTQQVLFNLMRNSMEAIQGRPQRALTVASRPEAAGMVEVSVADTVPRSALVPG